jgi:predicted metalloprotease
MSGGQIGLAAGGGGIIVVIIALLFGLDPRQVAQVVQPKGQPQQQQSQKKDPNFKASPAEERQAQFSRVIFRDTEIVWDRLFAQLGKTYKKPTLVLFSDRVQSACGMADSGVGPFYCPGDDRVYIDLSFYHEMETKLKAGGEFARAYVLAHEVGHHVQRLLGYSARVDQTRQRYGPSHPETNRMSVRLELQADFLAGVWAHHGQKQFKFLQPGDIESAMNAANQIGDDTLQKRGKGWVEPEKFTHGTSAQRMRWFKRGFDTGDVSQARLLFDLPYDEL